MRSLRTASDSPDEQDLLNAIRAIDKSNSIVDVRSFISRA